MQLYRNKGPLGTAREVLRGQALAFSAEHEQGRAVIIPKMPIVVSRTGTGTDKMSMSRSVPCSERGIGCSYQTLLEQRPRRSTDDYRIEWIDGVADQKKPSAPTAAADRIHLPRLPAVRGGPR